MILSYETLIKQWIKNKDYKSILLMKCNANREISHFINRDIVELLIHAENTGCPKTIAAIIKCTNPRRLLEIKSEFEPSGDMDMADSELFGTDAPTENVQEPPEDHVSHELILLILDEYLNSDNFTESMLKMEQEQWNKNEHCKFI
ncbi:hypothetical protein [Photobacterium damselae]|uniref:hypothetical protein n=1 Tax=Photobacterium damselae TaxID=38293 RepID=UPI004068B4D7